MRNNYLLALALLLVPAAAKAQQRNYWPLLRPGLVYQVSQTNTPGDTTHTVRLEQPARLPASPDSSYSFNQQVVAVRPAAAACYRTHAGRPNTLFGAQVLASGTEPGRYTLRHGSSLLTLRLRQPVGAVWAATATGITASVTARGTDSVLGQPDSVVTITLSTGQTVRIGKRYGWLEGPAPTDVLRNVPVPRRLTLSGLPQLGLGSAAIGDWAVFDYQPGDAFLRYYKQETYQGMTCEERWQLDSVLTRALSPDGNTVSYTMWSRTITRRFGSPGAPLGFCNNTPGMSASAPRTYALQVSRLGAGRVPLLSNTVAPGSGFVPVAGRSYTTANYQGRKVQPHVGRTICASAPADSLWLGITPDLARDATYAVGLGQVLESTAEISHTSSTVLLGYRKMPVVVGRSPETWGSRRDFALLLSAREKQPQTTTAATPNPFAAELTLRFEAVRAQETTVLLFDALGRQVLRRTQPVATGKAVLRLPTAELPAGVYALHLLREGRTEVMKVVKAQ